MSEHYRLPECPLKSLKGIIAFDSKDWGTNARDAWIYGIVLGWDEPAIKELADKHGWSPMAVDRLKRLHKKFESFERPSNGQR